MSIKTEVYYRFIFPDYKNLSGSDSDSLPTSDGADQYGEVRALCKECPERVITYDQLEATNPISMYADVWDNPDTHIQPYSRAFIKSCVDKYLTIPKYFNLRNYWDPNACQEGGMSLMVSDSPEVGGDYSSYTKFTVGTKTVYCAVMVSSGDFFYNFCLPEEVIAKSGLRDEIVASKFHSNWFISDYDITLQRTIPRAISFNNSDYKYYSSSPSSHSYIPDSNYPGYPYSDLLQFNSPSPGNPLKNHERRVFVQAYFSNFVQFGLQSGDEVTKYGDFNEDLKRDFINLEATRRILFYYSSTKLKNPDNGNYITITGTDDIPILDDTLTPDLGGAAQGYLWWSDSPNTDSGLTEPIRIKKYSNGSWNEVTVYTRPAYAANNCAYLRTWTKNIAKQLKENLNKTGKHTHVSYEPPDIYLTSKGGCPPLQIPYNLLRYALNDRPPFTDCETVLIMWVANDDPKDISDGNVAALNNLGWQQYAIPISVRCCFRDQTDNDSCPTNKGGPHKHIHSRFLVNYPREWSLSKDSNNNIIENKSYLAYRYHTRRTENCIDFPEVQYLQDLVHHSDKHIIVYQNSSTVKKGFDIQGYLLKKYEGAFEKLYSLKTYMTPTTTSGKAASNNFQGQLYYIRVNKEDLNGNVVFDINTYDGSSEEPEEPNSSDRRICICKHNSDTIEQFKPSDVIYRININNGAWDPHGSIAPSGDVSILGTVRHWNFDDVNYYETYGYNDWRIDDTSFITLFNVNYKIGNHLIFSRLTGTITIADSSTLHASLGWNDFYISSLGVTNYNPICIDSIYHTGTGSTIYPIGILDNHVKLNNVTYGSKCSNKKVIVGFEDMLDFHHEDLYHFQYKNNEYVPVRTTFNYSTWTYSYPVVSAPTCTAYVMDYTP